jgi:hypothetical protein
MFLGHRVLMVVGLIFAALAFRATEHYTSLYQTLPVLDWLESRPPLAESNAVPPAVDLARGLLRTMPLLTIKNDARPLLPVFGPPAFAQRTVGGVRDATRLEVGTPGALRAQGDPISARLDLIVFHRAVRAAGWSELMAREMDVRDPHTGAQQVRVSGPDAADAVWLVAPPQGGVATISGHRQTVGYLLQVTFTRPDATEPQEQIDLNARAEVAARRIAADWTAWLERELARAG